MIRGYHSNQSTLVHCLKDIFPNEEPVVNSRKQSQINNQSKVITGYLELDVWLPRYSVCFEFQDDYHYTTTWYHQNSTESVKQKDNIKRAALLSKGTRLVIIPCWWDGEKKSLISTISFACPDLLRPKKASPIALNPKFNYFRSTAVPGIGELMLASFPGSINLSDHQWWLGEKYDGIRCFWNPHRNRLYSRLGRKLLISPSMVPFVPSVPIDAEIWFGRGSFSHTLLVLSDNLDILWDSLRLTIFDSTLVTTAPFESRYTVLLSEISAKHPFALVVARILCALQEQILAFAKAIMEEKGEGVILRKPSSVYEHGRSASLLKLKSSFGDMEGIVAAIHQKSIILKLPGNTSPLAVPKENNVVANLSVGDVVTFSYDQNSHGVPVNPKIILRRPILDLGHPKPLLNTTSARRITKQEISPLEIANIRVQLEHFAQQQSLDPSLPSTWYKLGDGTFREDKNWKFIVRKFGSFLGGVKAVFPEIRFESDSLQKAKHRPEGGRGVFEKFAADNNFDPLIPENWYKTTITQLLSTTQSTLHIIRQHLSISKALLALFPEIGLDKSRLWTRDTIANNSESHREFFKKYASEKGFDPYDPGQWLRQPRANIMATQGAKRVLENYKGNVASALLEVFPEFAVDPRFWS